MMNKKILAVFGLFLLPISVFASQFPTSCPSVESLKQIKFQTSDIIQTAKAHGGVNANGDPYQIKASWAALDGPENYGTHYLWKVVFGNALADSALQARAILQKQLDSLVFVNGPVKEMASYLCFYHTTNGTFITEYRSI